VPETFHDGQCLTLDRRVITIGPEFTLSGNVDADFGLKNVSAAVDVSYDLKGASFTFPPQAGSSTDGISSSNKQVTFSANPDVGAEVTVTAHLIPKVSLGLEALGGLAKADVFLTVDSSLGLTGSVANVANPQPCLSGNAEVNVGVGAEGSFFSLFDASTDKSLFDKNFPLFKKCFGGNNSTSSQSSKPDSTAGAVSASATDSASQTSAASDTATDSASQTTAAGATDSASQTSTADATDSASQTSAAGTTVSASQTSVATAKVRPVEKRDYDAPRAVRHSARFGRSYLSKQRDLSHF